MQINSSNTIIALSIILSFTAMILIGDHWLKQGRVKLDRTELILNEDQLANFLKRETDAKTSANFADGPPIEIPTGVFIQSLVFTSSSDVNVTGYVWQKYPTNFPYQRGFNFPEQIASADTFIKEEYVEHMIHNGKPHTLVGSYFDVTVRQSFDYSNYPLDFLTIWLRIWPADWSSDTHVILVPDFDSYADIDQATFGLDPDLVQGEWKIARSFFSYHAMPYDTGFGYSSKTNRSVYQEMFFNLAAERKFINAFVINLVPLLVVSVLLFSALMTISNDEEQSTLFGFNTSGMLATCSALFFVVMLSHVQVRSLFAGSGLVYIEYFYLVLYAAILCTALNSYLFSLKSLRHSWILHYRDNFIAKVTFWPVLLWSMTFITWIIL